MIVVYIADNKLGGIASLINNLIANSIEGTNQKIILLDKKESKFTRIPYRFSHAEQKSFSVSALNNAYTIIRKLHKLLPREPGAIILNDSLEMQMLDHLPTELTSFQIVHDEYNFSLALKYPNVVDVFIAHSKFFYDSLRNSLPDRLDRIFYLPHGVKVPSFCRLPKDEIKVIRLLFLGRMSHAKGIFELPEIANWLRTWSIPFTFTCIGDGPELGNLKRIWHHDGNVTFLSPATTSEILDICLQHDVFVFPTHFEGTPVALLETMSVGLVPVVTDLPGGIREIVTDSIGRKALQGDTRSFAMAVKELFFNPKLLNELSEACRDKIKTEFDVTNTARAYHDLFSKYPLYFRKKKLEKRKLGFRLDHPFIPNLLTKVARILTL
jgi:glycosyltransferase involved in cell wall biosynthesis